MASALLNREPDRADCIPTWMHQSTATRNMTLACNYYCAWANGCRTSSAFNLYSGNTLLTLGRRVTVVVLCVCVCVCVSVCLSVTTLAATSFVFTLKNRYVGVCYRLFLDLTRGFSKKHSLRKLWREKANMQMSSYKSVRPIYRGRFSSLLRRVILMFPIVDRRYGSTLLALYGSGNVQRSIGLPPYKYGI